MAVRLGETAQYAFAWTSRKCRSTRCWARVRLEFLGAIHCTHCGRKTKKSFSQGYCYPCFTKLAQCDSCIVGPEKCHWTPAPAASRSGASCLHDRPRGVPGQLLRVKVGITSAPARFHPLAGSGRQPGAADLPCRASPASSPGWSKTVAGTQVADKTNLARATKAMYRSICRPSATSCRKAARGHCCAQALVLYIQPSAMPKLEIRYPVEPTRPRWRHDPEKTPVVEGILRGISAST